MNTPASRSCNTAYEGGNLSRIAFPLGGMGAGMICVEGGGAFSHVSVRNVPGMYHEPSMFAAVNVLGQPHPARVLEGPVPDWKRFGGRGTGNGAKGHPYGLPRFQSARFAPRFPFADIQFEDPAMPLICRLNAWSPFIPGNADDSGLPAAVLEYRFENPTTETLEAVFSFHAENFLAGVSESAAVDRGSGGFILRHTGEGEESKQAGAFSVSLQNGEPKVDCGWFRGGWFDAATLVWQKIDQGKTVENPPHSEGRAGPGGSLYQSFSLAPGQKCCMTLLLTWYVPESDLCTGSDAASVTETYVPWYATKFPSVESLTGYVAEALPRLHRESRVFSDSLYHSSLPPEVTEAVAANLTILKSPTVLRQSDGRLWGWEGCQDARGCCDGSCSHVWNYAQSLPHLFPEMERSLRQTEFGESQNDEGHQLFRAPLPIRPVENHSGHAAADGQLGGIMKFYRDWRIHGNTGWLRETWPRIRSSLEYCIRTWDPGEEGILREPHHNTYDIEFWGPDGMCGSFYLGALKAAVLMAETLGQPGDRYQELYQKGRAYLEQELFNGGYFIQQIQWTGLRAGSPLENEDWNVDYSPEARELMEKEGPKYQYGTGCLSDGVLGAWMAEVCGLGEILDPEKVRSHLMSVFRYNFRKSLKDHANPQRPGYALGDEGGLLLCTWPQGGELSLPFVYSNEVWTGIEYQVASHLMRMGCVEEGLEIVRTLRSRYDGRVRNPFDEYECGHWYARAMASYSLLQGLGGIRYDAVDKILYIEPRIAGDFHSFFSTEGAWGTAGVRQGEPFYTMSRGSLEVEQTVYTPWEAQKD